MSDDLKDILSNLNKDIEQEKLLEYLNRKLSAEEQHRLEMQMNDDEFVSDAMDGLQELKNADKVSLTISQLNAHLKKQLEYAKKKRRKLAFIENSWIYYTIILLLVLAVIGFLVIKKFIGG